MTRVLSGVVLGAVALALIWFLDSTALLGVALAVCAARLPRIRAHCRADRREACRTGRRCWRRCSRARWCRSSGSTSSRCSARRCCSWRSTCWRRPRRRAAARRHGRGHARAGLHRPAARQPGRRARDRRPGSGAAADRDGGGERHGAVLHRPRPSDARRWRRLRSPKKTREGAVGGFVDRAGLPRRCRQLLAADLSVVVARQPRARHRRGRHHRRPVRVDAETRRRHERQRHADSRPRRRARSHRRAVVRRAGVLFLPARC